MQLLSGAGFSVVWQQFLALIGIGALFFAISLWRFRKTLGQMAEGFATDRMI
jgi:ABC-2 type transport system permease protein